MTHEPEREEFIREGMKRYGDAAMVLVTFGKEIEQRLQAILKERTNWGSFEPTKAKLPRSTRYWSEYPLLNARIEGALEGAPLTITLCINWFESSGSYPFYVLLVDPRQERLDREREGNIRYENDQLRLIPDPDDFDLERDCGRLLDAFVEGIKLGSYSNRE